MSSSAAPRREAGTGSTGGPLLSCRGVDVAYDKVQVLFGVDLDVERGEIVALLGTNGAGKSTLLKAVSGLVQPTAGTDRASTASTSRKPTPSPTARAGHRPGARRQGGLPDADRRRALQGRRLAVRRRGPGKAVQRAPRRCSTCSRGCASGGTRWPATCPAASSSSSRSAWPSSPSRSCSSSTSCRSGWRRPIVGQLLEIVRRIHASGCTIVLVEQSINVALTIADEGVLHGEGRGALLRSDRGAARARRHPALGVPARRHARAWAATARRPRACASASRCRVAAHGRCSRSAG